MPRNRRVRQQLHALEFAGTRLHVSDINRLAMWWELRQTDENL